MAPCSRDLLPLPLEGHSHAARRDDASRCQARCVRRRRGLGRHIDEVCSAVNSLNAARAGHGLRRGPWPQMSSATEAQCRVRGHFGGLVRQLGVPSKPAGALSELLKSSDVYELDRAVSMRPFVTDKVKAVQWVQCPGRSCRVRFWKEMRGERPKIRFAE